MRGMIRAELCFNKFSLEAVLRVYFLGVKAEAERPVRRPLKYSRQEMTVVWTRRVE